MRFVLRWAKRLGWVAFGTVAMVLVCDAVIRSYASGKINTDAKSCGESYTALVLGTRVYAGGMLSNTLRLRCDRALELYRLGKVKRILVSGDHGQSDYDEVNAMAAYFAEKGVPRAHIFLDHAGFDTHDSVVRAREVFDVSDVIIVSQGFHLPRALFLAEMAGLKAQGCAAADSKKLNKRWISVRESLARVKACYNGFFHSEPTYLGERIPISGSSAATYD